MNKAKEILILNGPNLNMLGVRDPKFYGVDTLKDIENACREHATSLGLILDFQQSNVEGDMVEIIHQAREKSSGIIINAAAYTHTSVAILDALEIASLPVIEVHLSHIYQREEFRQKSYIAKIATGSICGFGGYGYILALDAINNLINN